MEKGLKDLGLTEKEVIIFLNLLKLGPSTTNKIAHLSQKPRSSTYDLLSSLMKKGFLNSFIKNKKTYYQAIEPKQILQQEEGKIYNLKKLIPRLEEIQNKEKDSNIVENYEGLKGVASMLGEVYNNKEILAYGSGKITAKYMDYLPKQLAVKRAEERIKMRLIMEKSIYSTFRVDEKKLAKVTELRIINEMKDYPAMVFITEKSVAIVMMGGEELKGILMKNKGLIKTQRAIFEYLWKRAKPYENN